MLLRASVLLCKSPDY